MIPRLYGSHKKLVKYKLTYFPLFQHQRIPERLPSHYPADHSRERAKHDSACEQARLQQGEVRRGVVVASPGLRHHHHGPDPERQEAAQERPAALGRRTARGAGRDLRQPRPELPPLLSPSPPPHAAQQDRQRRDGRHGRQVGPVRLGTLAAPPAIESHQLPGERGAGVRPGGARQVRVARLEVEGGGRPVADFAPPRQRPPPPAAEPAIL